MGVSIWEAGLGTSQGRIHPANWVPPPAGTEVYCLGSDEPGVTGRMKVGDFMSVSQAGEYPNSSFRFQARTRGPSSVPDECWWEAAFSVGGSPVLVWRVDAGEQLDFADLGWEVVSGATGALSFSLTLRGPSGLVVEPELPAFYIDNIVFAAASAASFRLSDRFPEPASTGVRADRPISFDLFPSSTPASAITVTVNGAPAFAGGVFLPAFAGALSSQGTTGGGSRRWVIDPLGVWGDEEAVTVVVTDGTTTVTWSFTGERTAGPRVSSAVAQGLQQVRVTMDEAPVAVSPSAAGDALNPASYSITRAPGEIAAQVRVTGVAQVSDAVFDLMTDIPLSPSKTYELTVLELVDGLGNVTEPGSPGASVAFLAYQPPVPAGRSFDLYAMMPEKNRLEDQTGELAAFLACLQDPLDLLLGVIDSFSDVMDPNLAPEGFVDAMLEDLANPFSLTLTLTQKRLLVQLLLAIYKQKGTAPGIVNVIRLFLGISMTHVSLGWGVRIDGEALLGDGGANPGTFILGSDVGEDPFSFELVTPVVLTDDQTTQGTAIVEFMKRGECVFKGFVFESTPPAPNPVELGFDSVLGNAGSFPGTFILH